MAKESLWVAMLALAVIFSSVTANPARAGTSTADATTSAAGTSGTAPNIILLHNGLQIDYHSILSIETDEQNQSATVTVSPSAPFPISVLIRRSWLQSFAPHPGFANTSYALTVFSADSWYNITIPGSAALSKIRVREFSPEQTQAWFTAGSPRNVDLERPMTVRIAEAPHVEFRTSTIAGANGTWTESRPVTVNRLGISFEGVNTSGQRIMVNRSWLATFGLQNVGFGYADGTPITNESDGFNYYLHPPHFSILYAFTVGDGFTKESDEPYSDVHWDSSNRNIYVLSDRQDPSSTNERLSSPAPVTYDQTTSFIVRGTWKTSQQGNWQSAIPLYFMSSSNTQVDAANSIYVLYWSRDFNLGNQPLYYLRYRDSTGALRIDINDAVNANVQIEFSFYYDAPTRFMQLGIYDVMGSAIDVRGYSLGAGETFTLGKIGTASCSCTTPHTSEPTTIATADNLYIDANRARNGNFEIDSNSDGVPDYWQNWIWTKGNVYRSSDRAKYGSWSVKIQDSSSTDDYGLQTNYLLASASETYVGSSWIYVVSGSNAICVEAWNSQGSRLGVSCRGTVAHNGWEYVDISLLTPSGTSSVDLLLYSGASNTGTAYFDAAEIHLRRAFWSVTIHNNEPMVQGLSGWQRAIDRAADLGVSYIRTDFNWNSFQSSNGVWVQSTIDYYQRIRNMAKTRGIDLVAILQGPAPSGVNSNNVYSSFQSYCQGIGVRFGGVYYYQLLNEANWQPSRTLDGYDQNSLILNCYIGLVLGTGSLDYTHRYYFKTIVNVYVTLLWNLNLISAITYDDRSIDIAAIDYYPSSFNNPTNLCNDWSPLDTLWSIMKTYSREGAIMETGYPTSPDPNTGITLYQLQVDYINCALPVIRSKATSDNIAAPSTPFVIANWYELYDHLTGSYSVPPLNVYGLIKSDNLGDKPGLATFRGYIPTFTY